MKGKEVRLSRLFGSDGKIVMVPMDHGITCSMKNIENNN